MHFLTYVVVPPGYDGDPVEYVERALEPFYEEDGNPSAFWDWYQIGGRWSGHLSPSYNPTTDPRNIETCNLCGGTGTRNDWSPTCTPEWIAECNGCNGCKGTGASIKWPTQWVESPVGNFARLGDIREFVESEEGRPYYLLHEGVTRAEVRNPDWVDDGDWSDYWIRQPEEVIDAIRKLSDDCTVVVVDCHC